MTLKELREDCERNSTYYISVKVLYQVIERCEKLSEALEIVLGLSEILSDDVITELERIVSLYGSEVPL